MAELKTKKTSASVPQFINAIADPGRRADCKVLLRMMKDVTGEKPAMWGASIVGFGSYDYAYDSGRTGTWMITGFSPRKQDLTLYVMPGIKTFAAELEKLGPHKTGVSCLYLKRLSDVHLPTLRTIVARGYKAMRKAHPATSTRRSSKGKNQTKA